MVKGVMQQWLRVIITLLILLITEGHPVDITYLQSAVAKGAVCLDGSPPAYHFDKGFGAGVNNWFIQLEDRVRRMNNLSLQPQNLVVYMQ